MFRNLSLSIILIALLTISFSVTSVFSQVVSSENYKNEIYFNYAFTHENGAIQIGMIKCPIGKASCRESIGYGLSLVLKNIEESSVEVSVDGGSGCCSLSDKKRRMVFQISEKIFETDVFDDFLGGISETNAIYKQKLFWGKLTIAAKEK